MNRYSLLGLAVGLVVGIFIGYEMASSGRMPAPAALVGPGPTPQMPPVAAGDNYQARIALAQQQLAREPKNVQAWIQLGNDYFDTRQAQKSVDAYARALELAPDNPDVITDQGVMYRELGQFAKAVANFQKASRIAPKHVQSLYNLGVVYANDLGQPAKALTAWQKVIEIAPESQQAVQAKTAIEQLKKR